MLVYLLWWDIPALLVMSPSARMRPSLALISSCRMGDGRWEGRVKQGRIYPLYNR